MWPGQLPSESISGQIWTKYRENRAESRNGYKDKKKGEKRTVRAQEKLANKQSKKRRVTGDIATLVANMPPKGSKLYMCSSAKKMPPIRHYYYYYFITFMKRIKW